MAGKSASINPSNIAKLIIEVKEITLFGSAIELLH